MSEGDRLFHPVTGSLAAIFLMLLAAALVGHANRYHGNHSNSGNQSAHQAQSPMAPSGPSGPSEQPSAEERREAREEADLAAQYRMARAAENAVYISAFALLGLALTVHFARKAWLAAQASAKADNEALELTRTQLNESREAAAEQADHMNRQVWAMQDTARASQQHARITRDVAARQSRCYIEPTGGKFIKPDPEKVTILTNVSSIKLNCVNHGESIGREIYCLYEVEFVDLDKPSGILSWREFIPSYKSEHPNVAPKSPFSIDLDLNVVKQIEDAPYDGRTMSIIRGAVYYRDVFDEQFRSGFVLLGLIPINSGLVAREIPFGMSRASQDRPTFQKVEQAKNED